MAEEGITYSLQNPFSGFTLNLGLIKKGEADNCETNVILPV
jgi:hypothetical protein